MTAKRDKSGKDTTVIESPDQAVQGDLLRIAHMFGDFRDDPVMRELCRLAIKCAQERLLRGG